MPHEHLSARPGVGPIRRWWSMVSDAQTAWQLLTTGRTWIVSALPGVGALLLARLRGVGPEAILWGLGALALAELALLLLNRVRRGRPRIEYLRQERSFVCDGNEKDPPAYIARFLHLVNNGQETVLSDWGGSVVMPGAAEIDLHVLSRGEWERVGGAYGSVIGDATILTRDSALPAFTMQPVRAVLMLAAPHLALGDLRVGSNIRVSCQDRSGRRWPLEGPVNSRLSSALLVGEIPRPTDQIRAIGDVQPSPDFTRFLLMVTRRGPTDTIRAQVVAIESNGENYGLPFPCPLPWADGASEKILAPGEAAAVVVGNLEEKRNAASGLVAGRITVPCGITPALLGGTDGFEVSKRLVVRLFAQGDSKSQDVTIVLKVDRSGDSLFPLIMVE